MSESRIFGKDFDSLFSNYKPEDHPLNKARRGPSLNVRRLKAISRGTLKMFGIKNK